MVYSKSIFAVSSSLKSLKTSSSDSFLLVWFELFEPFVWFEFVFDDELFDDCPLIDDDRLSAISAVAKRWTYSKNIIHQLSFQWFFQTNLWLFSCSLQACEDKEQQHHHLTDPPDLDRQVIAEEMIRKYWRDLYTMFSISSIEFIRVHTIHRCPGLINYIETDSTGPNIGNRNFNVLNSKIIAYISSIFGWKIRFIKPRKDCDWSSLGSLHTYQWRVIWMDISRVDQPEYSILHLRKELEKIGHYLSRKPSLSIDLLSRGPANLTMNSLRPDMSVTWCFDSILRKSLFLFSNPTKNELTAW